MQKRCTSHLPPDTLVTVATQSLLAPAEATHIAPIVVLGVADPVEAAHVRVVVIGPTALLAPQLKLGNSGYE